MTNDVHEYFLLLLMQRRRPLNVVYQCWILLMTIILILILIFSKRERIRYVCYAIADPSVVCLSVCDVGAPYSAS